MGLYFFAHYDSSLYQLVLFSLVGGIGALSNLQLGRIASRTIGFYLVSTAVAISIGLGLSNILELVGLSSATQEALRSTHSETVGVKITQAVAPDGWSTLLNIIPTNPFALADGKYVASFVLFNCLRNGCSQPTRKRTDIVGEYFDGLTNVIIRIIQGLMKMAPLAVLPTVINGG